MLPNVRIRSHEVSGLSRVTAHALCGGRSRCRLEGVKFSIEVGLNYLHIEGKKIVLSAGPLGYYVGIEWMQQGIRMRI